MKKITTLFAGLCLSLTMASAQDATVTVKTSQPGAKINKEIYGQFAEHLGRCIYGGIWVGPDSEVPNIQGYRKDVFEALKELEVPVLRWPGGCFADEYHWRDGIGPKENRRKMVNTNWGGTVEDNSFGTHEFLNLCEMLGIEPYISGNVGSGTVEEMAKWVEYMNSDTNSTIAEERRKNGREKPWNVKYFGVGNESWGCGGNMTIEYYVNLYRRYNTYARNYGDNRLFRIASGANGGDTHWMDVAMRECRFNMDGISVHFYAVRDWGSEDDPITGIPMGKKGSALNFTDQDYYEIVSKSLELEDIINAHSAVMDRYDPEKKVAIMFDEWGTWFNVEPGTNPGWLYQQSTMRDAVVAASSLNIFHKYTDRVKMANIAQVVNVLQSMILTKDDKMVLTPTYYVFKMYKDNMEAVNIPIDVKSDTFSAENEREKGQQRTSPYISASAAKTADGAVIVNLANADLAQSNKVTVDLGSAKGKVVEATILTSKDMKDCNTFENPDKVKPAAFKGAKIKGGQLVVDMPKMSIVVVKIK